MESFIFGFKKVEFEIKVDMRFLLRIIIEKER